MSNWSSKNHRWEQYDEDNYFSYPFSVEGTGLLKRRKNKMTRHNLAMFGGLLVVFVTAVFPLLHGGHMTPAEIFTAVVTGLIAVEHSLAGKTGTTTS